MKLKLTLALAVILCSCRQVRNDNQIFILKADVQDTVMQYLSVVSDKEFSKFITPAEVRYFLDDNLVDSIIQPDFDMISWYSIKNDTTDLVVHISRFETSALLLRFIDEKPFVFHYRAPHSDQNFFKLNRNDSFTSQVEVPSTRYKLSISKIPDSKSQPVVFGQIEMESYGYYDKRDTLPQKHSIKMKFCFRSQYRKFD